MTDYAPNTGPSTRAGKCQEYEVLLVRDYEYPGYAVFCPSLGCASQGDTREEALEMIADAIAMYLDSYAEDGLEPPFTPDAMAPTVAEYQAEGYGIEIATVLPADWDAIIADCSAAIQRNPNDAKAYLTRGGTYLNKREYDRAIADYTTVISLTPDDAEAYCRRGDAYRSSGKYNRAIADYDATLRRDPYYDIAYVSLEMAYVALWKREKSI